MIFDGAGVSTTLRSWHIKTVQVSDGASLEADFLVTVFSMLTILAASSSFGGVEEEQVLVIVDSGIETKVEPEHMF